MQRNDANKHTTFFNSTLLLRVEKLLLLPHQRAQQKDIIITMTKIEINNPQQHKHTWNSFVQHSSLRGTRSAATTETRNLSSLSNSCDDVPVRLSQPTRTGVVPMTLLIKYHETHTHLSICQSTCHPSVHQPTSQTTNQHINQSVLVLSQRYIVKFTGKEK